MNDILGRVVAQGDLVFTLDAYGSGVSLKLAKVVGFTRTLVKLEMPDCLNTRQHFLVYNIQMEINKASKKKSNGLLKTSNEDAVRWIENNFEAQPQEPVLHTEYLRQRREAYIEYFIG